MFIAAFAFMVFSLDSSRSFFTQSHYYSSKNTILLKER
jgi:hypothetical protein